MTSDSYLTVNYKAPSQTIFMAICQTMLPPLDLLPLKQGDPGDLLSGETRLSGPGERP